MQQEIAAASNAAVLKYHEDIPVQEVTNARIASTM